VSLAKVWFMVTGYAIHWTLPRLISSENYGNYQLVIGIISILNAVIITGTSQTVSKYVSQQESSADAVKRAALKIQLVIGGGATLGFVVASPVLAAYLNDPRLTNYFRLASLITLSYSFYAVFTGYFNGQRRFLTQAAVDATYSTMKVVLIVLLVVLGLGVTGAVGGFVLAAAGVLVVAAVAARSHRTSNQQSTAISMRQLIGFQTYVLLFTLVLNLLQRVDMILLKSLSSPDPTIASQNVGAYSAAINLANITYQVIIAVTFVMFPLISRATFDEDRDRTRLYVRNTMRYTVMVMAGLATLFSANAVDSIRVVYRAEYEVAAPALSIVAYGMLFFGIVYVATAMISASGHPRASLAIGTATLVASVGLNAALVPRYGITGAALATTLAMFVGAILSAAYLLARFHAFMGVDSLLRIIGCSGLVYLASLAIPTGSLPVTLARFGLLALLYLAALVASREIGSTEISAFRRILHAGS